MNGPSHVSVEGIADTLVGARRSNRRIVPIIGAGLSADSGFPVLDAINRYFGKLHQYIALRGYLAPGLGQWNSDPLSAEAAQYADRPWEFIRRFHWPDRFQLNQDLHAHLSYPDPDSTAHRPQSISDAVRMGQLAILRKINPERLKWYENVRSEVDRIVHDRPPNSGPIAGVEQEVETAFAGRGPWNTPFDLLGDWRKVIQYLTNYQPDDADALFARFGLNRQPALGHRFLAFLVRELHVQTVFTYNFDTLIERALVDAGMRPEVFAMEGGVGIPSHTHLRDHLSVIKLHGSTHAILVDERLDHPLADTYKERFDKAVGKHPLLFVVGCSGGDHRLRDLVDHVLSRSHGAPGPSVVWLHYEERPPKFLTESSGTFDGVPRQRVQIRGTNNPGLTLYHLHALLTGTHPASDVPYLTHIVRPFKLGRLEQTDLPRGLAIDPNAPASGYLFTSLGVGRQRPPGRSASHQLFLLASHLARKGFHPIWVDLESVHTLAGVVGSIIDQCRGYDPTLPPTVMPLGEAPEALQSTIEAGVARVSHALRRTRYLLAFDGLETYVWPSTTHHGLTHVQAHKAPAALDKLIDFINRLAAEDLGESRLAASVDHSKTRHPTAHLERTLKLQQQVKRLVRAEFPVAGGKAFRFTSVPAPAGARPSPHCSHRRTRTRSPSSTRRTHRSGTRPCAANYRTLRVSNGDRCSEPCFSDWRASAGRGPSSLSNCSCAHSSAMIGGSKEC